MSDNPSQDTQQEPHRPEPPSPIWSLLATQRTDLLLFITRLLTLVFALHALLTGDPTSYQRALLAAASTSALRLHQRLPPFQVSREYWALVVTEDAAHYLLYCLIFCLSRPLSLSLLAVTLFAFLHASSFALILLERTGSQNQWMARSLQSVVAHQRSLLQTAALAEIALMPSVLIGLFSGHVSLLVPFLYYRFIIFRYTSRRNPYSRQMFVQIRYSVEGVARHPSCPQLVRSALVKAVDLVSRLAPNVNYQ